MSEIFWSLHSGLPRQVPGSDATTLAMLDVLGERDDDAVREVQRELDVRSAHADEYGYVALVLRR